MKSGLIAFFFVTAGLASAATGVEATMVKAGISKAQADLLVGRMLNDLYVRGDDAPRLGAVSFAVEGWAAVPSALRPATKAATPNGVRMNVRLYHARKAGGLIVVSGRYAYGKKGGLFDYFLKVRQGRWEVASVTQTGRS